MGYDTLSANVEIPRYRRVLQRVPVALNSNAIVRGALRVRFEGCSTRFQQSKTRIGEVGRIMLHGPGSLFAFALHEWGNGEFVLQGVPAGRYEVTLESDGGFVAYAPREGRTIEVASGEAQVTFDLTQTTELEFVLLD